MNAQTKAAALASAWSAYDLCGNVPAAIRYTLEERGEYSLANLGTVCRQFERELDAIRPSARRPGGAR